MKYKLFLLICMVFALTAFATEATVLRVNDDFQWLGTSQRGTFTGLSTDAKPTSYWNKSVTAGAAFIELDTGLISYYDGTSWRPKFICNTSATDTTSIVGNTDAVSVNGYTNATFALYDSLNGNTSVTVRPEGFITGLGWGPIDAENDTTQITTTGVWYRNYSSVAGLDSLRLRYFSKAGSAQSFITRIIRLWNQYK